MKEIKTRQIGQQQQQQRQVYESKLSWIQGLTRLKSKSLMHNWQQFTSRLISFMENGITPFHPLIIRTNL